MINVDDHAVHCRKARDIIRIMMMIIIIIIIMIIIIIIIIIVYITRSGEKEHHYYYNYNGNIIYIVYPCMGYISGSPIYIYRSTERDRPRACCTSSVKTTINNNNGRGRRSDNLIWRR